MAAYTSVNHATATTDGAGNGKPRVLSIAGQYSAGPIYVSAGYEQHDEFAGPNAPGSDQEDKGFHIGAAYTWGPVRFGGQWTRQEFDTTRTLSSKVDAWHVGVDWRIVGPHGLRAYYTKAGDMKGDVGAPAIGGANQTTRPAVGGDTGADLFGIRYVYTFSKRTEFTFGYVKLDNDGNATTGGTYNLWVSAAAKAETTRMRGPWVFATRSKLAATRQNGRFGARFSLVRPVRRNIRNWRVLAELQRPRVITTTAGWNIRPVQPF